MILTYDQEKAVKTILDKYHNGDRYATLAGWAGTGKSTTIRVIVDALLNTTSLKEEDIGYACYCGKAVQVLIDKGNKNAVTLHKLLYKAFPKPDGSFSFMPKPIGSLEYKVVIVDETSMITQNFIDLLLRHPIFVIFCGDNGQLGAIKGQGNNLLDKPDAFLDKVMRQAQESGIIRLSMLIREGKDYKNFNSDDAMVLPKSELSAGALLWADQVICATNATRRNINSQIRQLKGYTRPVEENENLICLTNEWSMISNNDNALTNGTIGTLSGVFETWQQYPKYLQVKDNKVALIGGKFISNTGDDFGNIFIDKQCIITGEPYLTGINKYKIGKTKKYKDTLPFEFTYSYAITCWKAQGSEFPKVLIIEENFPYDKNEHKKFLYTAITRSEDRCVLFTD